MWSKELMVLSLISKHGQRPQILWSREMITSFCSASESPPRCIYSYVIKKAMSVPFQRISGPRLSMLTISVAWSHYHYSLWMGCKSIKGYPSPPPYISYIAGCPPGFKRGSARVKHLPQEHNITTVWPVTRSQVQSLWKTFWLIRYGCPKHVFDMHPIFENTMLLLNILRTQDLPSCSYSISFEEKCALLQNYNHVYLEKNESGIHVRVCLEVENLQIFNQS